MLIFSNIRRPAVGRLGVVLGLTLAAWFVTAVTIVTPALGQTATDPAQQIDAPLLDESHAQRAYLAVETWLNDSPEVPTRIGPIRVTGLIGVRLTLRTEGVLVGQGEAYREDLSAMLDQVGPSIDLVPLLRAATDQAKASVLQSLADARLRTVLEGRAIPGAGELRVKDVAAGMIVELELSYGLRSISLPADADDQSLYARFAPGYHGLAFTEPDTGRFAWLWPGEVIARNIAPASQPVVGLKRLGYERTAVAHLARPKGVGLSRFQTIHLVRPRLGDNPVRLVRGAIDLPRYAIGEKDLEILSDRLLEHLNNRITTTGQVRGTYWPTSGRYDPNTAPDDQAALLCYAMMHHCKLLTVTRPDDAAVVTLTKRAGLAMDVLSDRLQLAGEEAETRVLALVLLAMLEAPAAEVDPAVRDQLANRLLARIAELGKENTANAGEILSSDGDLALSAAVLATLYERTRRPEMGQAARALLDRLWQDNSVPNLSALPWLMLAQERAGNLLADADDSGAYKNVLAQRSALLAKLIERLCRQQVIDKPGIGPDDVLGGFLLSPGPAGAPPNPDWHSAQALMLIASSLRDKKITEDSDVLGWMLSAGLGARYIGQLMIDDAGCYYVRDRTAARGGVRMAPWDNRLAIAPSAMCLLALTELQTTLRSFDAGGN